MSRDDDNVKRASMLPRQVRLEANASLGILELTMLRRFGRMPNLHPDAEGPDFFYPDQEIKH